MFTHYHDYLCGILEKLNYRGTHAGICYGYASAATSAFLSGHMTTFMQREQALNAIIDKCYTSTALREQNIAAMIMIIEQAIQNKVDFFAYFDSLILHSTLASYADIFVTGVLNQDILKTSTMVAPLALEDKGNLIELIKFSGLYSLLDLKDYFLSFQASVNEKNACPRVSLFLESGNHAIHVGYCSERQYWYCGDSNQIPVNIITNIDTLVDYIYAAFLPEKLVSTSGYTGFVTHVICTHSDYPHLFPKIQQWQKHALFSSIHLLKEEKKRAMSTSGYSWLWLATLSQELEKVKASYNPSLYHQDARNISPLFLAAYFGYLDFIAFFCEKNPAMINYMAENNYTPLMATIDNRLLCATKILLENKATVDMEDNQGKTALWHAAKMGNENGIRLLIAYQAKVNIKNKYGVSPLMIAIEHGHFEVAKILIENGANPVPIFKKHAMPYHGVEDFIVKIEKKYNTCLLIINTIATHIEKYMAVTDIACLANMFYYAKNQKNDGVFFVIEKIIVAAKNGLHELNLRYAKYLDNPSHEIKGVHDFLKSINVLSYLTDEATWRLTANKVHQMMIAFTDTPPVLDKHLEMV